MSGGFFNFIFGTSEEPTEQESQRQQQETAELLATCKRVITMPAKSESDALIQTQVSTVRAVYMKCTESTDGSPHEERACQKQLAHDLAVVFCVQDGAPLAQTADSTPAPGKK